MPAASSTTCSTSIEVSVYLQPPCGTPNAPSNCLTPAEQAQIQKTLQQLPQVKCVTYISTASAYQRFKADFAGDPDLIKQHPEERAAGVVRGAS